MWSAKMQYTVCLLCHLRPRPMPRAGASRNYGSALRPAFFTQIFNN